MSENLAFNNHFSKSSRGVIKAAGVLTFKTMKKVHYKSSCKCLDIKDIARDTAKLLRLRVEPDAESVFNLSFLLLPQKKIQDVRVTEGDIKARFLQEHLRLLTEVILKANESYTNKLTNPLN